MFDLFNHGPLYNEADDPGAGGGGGGTGDPGSGSAAGLLGAPGATPAAGDDPGSGDPGSGSGGEDFAFTSLLGEDGNFNEGWQNDLATAHPELEQFRETFGNYKNPVEALKALGNTKALVGRKLNDVATVLNPNREDATAMGLYRQSLGIPEEGSVKAYGYTVPEEFAEVADQKQLDEFAQWAHEHDFTPKQFSEAVNYQLGLMSQMGGAQAEAQAAQQEQQKAAFWEEANKELGGKEETDKALDLTVRMLRAGGMEDEAIQAVGALLPQMPVAFVKAMTSLAKNTSEDKLPAGGSSASQAISAKDAYRSIIHNAEDPKHAIYHNPNHPDHESVRAEVRQLIARSKKK